MNIINSLLGVQFGGVTLTLLAVVVLVLGAALVTQLGIWLVKFAIAADDDNAPKFDIKNVIWEKVSNFLDNMEVVLSRVGKKGDSYYVKNAKGDYCDNDRTSDTRSDADCRYSYFSTKQRAIKCSRKHNGIFNKVVINMVLASIATDIVLLSLSHYFFPTVVLCSIASFFALTRYISRKVYANSGKIDKHEERITKLEGDK